MRLTQLGHQVPRRNSTITGPRCNNSASEKLPDRFAALRAKPGALSPTFRVSVVVLSANEFVQSRLLRSVPQNYVRSKQADSPQCRAPEILALFIISDSPCEVFHV